MTNKTIDKIIESLRHLMKPSEHAGQPPMRHFTYWHSDESYKEIEKYVKMSLLQLQTETEKRVRKETIKRVMKIIEKNGNIFLYYRWLKDNLTNLLNEKE